MPNDKLQHIKKRPGKRLRNKPHNKPHNRPHNRPHNKPHNKPRNKPPRARKRRVPKPRVKRQRDRALHVQKRLPTRLAEKRHAAPWGGSWTKRPRNAMRLRTAR